MPCTLLKKFTMPLLIAALLLCACAERAIPQEPLSAPDQYSPVWPPAPSTAPTTTAVRQVYRETGKAGWYGRELHGRKTESGETFDMYSVSAAHRTLPLGTTIRVTNLDNFRSVKVKVNDRGPFVKDLALELSLGAARELGFVEQGIARVKIETVEQVRENPVYTVQAAVFAEEENAKLLKERLSRRYELIMIVPYESNRGKLYRVRVGAYGTEEKAELIAGRLTLEGLEPFVVRKD